MRFIKTVHNVILISVTKDGHISLEYYLLFSGFSIFLIEIERTSFVTACHLKPCKFCCLQKVFREEVLAREQESYSTGHLARIYDDCCVQELQGAFYSSCQKTPPVSSHQQKLGHMRLTVPNKTEK